MCPIRPASAAQTREAWALAAIEACCGWAPGTQPPGSKDHRSDGLLVGPFQSSPPFDLLIVNTDGTLAERSGNGLTIFSQALSDQGLLPEEGAVAAGSSRQGRYAFTGGDIGESRRKSKVCRVSGWTWANLASGRRRSVRTGVESVRFNGRELSHVQPLSALNAAWSRSQFVRVGNPHCVTLVDRRRGLAEQ